MIVFIALLVEICLNFKICYVFLDVWNFSCIPSDMLNTLLIVLMIICTFWILFYTIAIELGSLGLHDLAESATIYTHGWLSGMKSIGKWIEICFFFLIIRPIVQLRQTVFVVNLLLIQVSLIIVS